MFVNYYTLFHTPQQHVNDSSLCQYECMYTASCIETQRTELITSNIKINDRSIWLLHEYYGRCHLFERFAQRHERT